MLIGETIGVALSAVRANKLRSLLTMLGIVIGVAAVITMVALGNGAQQAIQAQIDALGTNLLSVHPGQSFQRGVASEQRVALTVDDATALGRDGGPLLAEVVPELAGNRQIKYGNRNINVSVNSTTSNYFPVNKYELLAGRYFTRGDDQNRRREAARCKSRGPDRPDNPDRWYSVRGGWRPDRKGRDQQLQQPGRADLHPDPDRTVSRIWPRPCAVHHRAGGVNGLDERRPAHD
jgi:hypothetical protein